MLRDIIGINTPDSAKLAWSDEELRLLTEIDESLHLNGQRISIRHCYSLILPPSRARH